ncbi:hypothetical protein HanIR_Chr10g0451661 [Helianthus annuus]|nr:hypothetical protein HanIR_Chr10g0451661 [Helianthus annuus]
MLFPRVLRTLPSLLALRGDWFVGLGALKLDWKKTTSREICYDRKIEESLFIHVNERETRIVFR